ncbi:uncharacterized protein LOC144618162 [Crassostrea virginica]
MHFKETIDILHELIGKYQENQLDETEFLKVRDLFTEINDRTDLTRRMRDRDRDEMTPETFLERIGIPLIYDLIQEIEDAFCTGAPVLSSFGVLDPEICLTQLKSCQIMARMKSRKLLIFMDHRKMMHSKFLQKFCMNFTEQVQVHSYYSIVVQFTGGKEGVSLSTLFTLSFAEIPFYGNASPSPFICITLHL